MTDMEQSADLTTVSAASSAAPRMLPSGEDVVSVEPAQKTVEGSSHAVVDKPSNGAPVLDLPIAASAVTQAVPLSTPAEPVTTEKVAGEASNPVPSTDPATGHQYVVVLHSDQNGKVIGTSPQGPTILATGSVPTTAVAKPLTPVAVKRGATKASVTPKIASTTSALTGVVVSRPQMVSPRPVTVTPINLPVGQAIRMISLSSPTISSLGTPTQIYTPIGNTSPLTQTITSTTSVLRKPLPPVVKPVSPIISKPSIKVPVTVAPAPVTQSLSIGKKPLLKTPVQPVVNKVATPGKLPIITSASPAAKTGKPVAFVDKLIQQKRFMAESILKFRKIDRAMVQAKPDQVTPFTYGEIFQQAASSFSKMASLTTHISLESQTPAEQRRWSPDLINKFVSSINNFASTMKEVGDELKKRHEQQLVINLKRKADSEVVNAKKLAALGVNTVSTPVPAAVPSNGAVQLTNLVVLPGGTPDVVAASIVETVVASAVKHPLEISTETAIVAGHVPSTGTVNREGYLTDKSLTDTTILSGVAALEALGPDVLKPLIEPVVDLKMSEPSSEEIVSKAPDNKPDEKMDISEDTSVIEKDLTNGCMDGHLRPEDKLCVPMEEGVA